MSFQGTTRTNSFLRLMNRPGARSGRQSRHFFQPSMHCRLIHWAHPRGKARIDNECNLLPHAGIVLDLVMRLVKCSREPRVVPTIDVPAIISHVKISDDLCPSRIFCDHL